MRVELYEHLQGLFVLAYFGGLGLMSLFSHFIRHKSIQTPYLSTHYTKLTKYSTRDYELINHKPKFGIETNTPQNTKQLIVSL